MYLLYNLVIKVYYRGRGGLDGGIDRVGFRLDSEALEAVRFRLEAESGSRALWGVSRVEARWRLVEKAERVGSDPCHGDG